LSATIVPIEVPEVISPLAVSGNPIIWRAQSITWRSTWMAP